MKGIAKAATYGFQIVYVIFTIFDFFRISKWIEKTAYTHHVPFRRTHHVCVKEEVFFCVSVSVLVNWILLIFIKFLSFSPMQAFVRFCALVMATTVEVCAIVKKVTKVLNVKSQQENVKCLGALGMDVVLKANAIVSAVSKDMTALNVSFSHPHTYTFIKIHLFPKSHRVAIYILVKPLFTADCMDPTCSSHGTCINGQCFCKFPAS